MASRLFIELMPDATNRHILRIVFNDMPHAHVVFTSSTEDKAANCEGRPRPPLMIKAIYTTRAEGRCTQQVLQRIHAAFRRSIEHQQSYDRREGTKQI